MIDKAKYNKYCIFSRLLHFEKWLNFLEIFFPENILTTLKFLPIIFLSSPF